MFLRSTYVLTLLASIGCGAAPESAADRIAAGTAAHGTAMATGGVALQQAGPDGAGGIPTPAVPDGRKIIFTALLRINVEDFSAAAASVERLVASHNGFVTASQRGGASGTSRSGNWTLRVPVEEYRALLAALGELGELIDQQETSQEVTEEFYDLEARIANKQQQEQRLLTHLDETARNLQEILTVEGELGRVREEIERMQGRLRMLADRTSLSTIQLSLSEIEKFVPAAAPTFDTRIERSWNASIEAVTGLLQWIAITVVGLIPWLSVMGVAALLALPPALWLRRRVFVFRRCFGGGDTTAT